MRKFVSNVRIMAGTCVDVPSTTALGIAFFRVRWSAVILDVSARNVFASDRSRVIASCLPLHGAVLSVWLCASALMEFSKASSSVDAGIFLWVCKVWFVCTGWRGGVLWKWLVGAR